MTKLEEAAKAYAAALEWAGGCRDAFGRAATDCEHARQRLGVVRASDSPEAKRIVEAYQVMRDAESAHARAADALIDAAALEFAKGAGR